MPIHRQHLFGVAPGSIELLPPLSGGFALTRGVLLPRAGTRSDAKSFSPGREHVEMYVERMILLAEARHPVTPTFALLICHPYTHNLPYGSAADGAR